jgi:PAS domain S-box-containing protein
MPGTLIERSFAITQELTHIGSWEWSPDGGPVTWSDELYRIYGFAPQSQEITTEFFLSRVLEEDRPIVQRGIGQALEHGGSFNWSERIVRPDGTIRTLDTVGQVYDEAGRRVLFGTCRDVTDERERDAQLRRGADIFENVQIGLSVWAAGAEERGRDFVLLAVNPAGARIAGHEATSMVGRSFSELFPYAVDTDVEMLLGTVAGEGATRESVARVTPDATGSKRTLSLRGFPLSGRRVGLAVLDITAQTQERRLQAGEHAVLELVASGAPLAQALDTLVLAVEDHSPPLIGSILLVDVDGARLRHGAGPNLPDSYHQLIDGAVIGPKAGSCGTAAFLKSPVYVTDIESDPLWEDYRELARPYGLRACWSVPIMSVDERVLGTFAFYYKEPRGPTPVEKALAARAARLAGIAIERKQMEEQLRDLSAHVEQALETERTRIAREIHDDLGQSLTALKMDIAWILRRLPERADAPGDIGGKLAGMAALTDEMIKQVRAIASGLRPGVLDDIGLVAAIEWQAEAFEERTGKSCTVRSTPSDAKVDMQVATAAFRIFQEALTNVIRHAEATRVEVFVDVREEELCLVIQDDGRGIRPEASHGRKALGLLGIRERAQRLGGRVVVEAAQPHGTRVELWIPVPTQARR